MYGFRHTTPRGRQLIKTIALLSHFPLASLMWDLSAKIKSLFRPVGQCSNGFAWRIYHKPFKAENVFLHICNKRECAVIKTNLLQTKDLRQIVYIFFSRQADRNKNV